jgi:polar amino acid transport system substrate-binding protein
MSARAGLRVATTVICCATLTVGACASPPDDAQKRALDALAVQDPGSVTPHTPPTKADFNGPAGHCPPFRSLAPSAARPAPGRMPRGTYMHTIQRNGQLNVGVDQNTRGLGYFNSIRSEPRMEGFEIDLVREIARAIFGDPDKIRYTAISTQQRPSVVQRGDVDLVASSFSIDCDRRKSMRFSSVYYRAQMRLLVPKRPKVTGLRDLRGKYVCVTNKSTTIRRLTELQPRTAIKIYVVPLRSDCLVKLQQGTVQAISSDDAILLGLNKQDPQTKIVGPGLQCESWGIAINKKHPEFVRFVNAVLARLDRSGYTQRRRDHWLKGLTPPKTRAPCS